MQFLFNHFTSYRYGTIILLSCFSFDFVNSNKFQEMFLLYFITNYVCHKTIHSMFEDYHIVHLFYPNNSGFKWGC